MREGIGTSNGELLKLEAKLGEDVVTWRGRVFRTDKAKSDAETLPEAFPTENGLLPHLHSDLEERFPRALAGPGAGDEEPEENRELEKRGEALGKDKARFGKSEARQLTSNFENKGTQLSLASKHDQHRDGVRNDPPWRGPGIGQRVVTKVAEPSLCAPTLVAHLVLGSSAVTAG